jgi:hypothetical protein
MNQPNQNHLNIVQCPLCGSPAIQGRRSTDRLPACNQKDCLLYWPECFPVGSHIDHPAPAEIKAPAGTKVPPASSM